MDIVRYKDCVAGEFVNFICQVIERGSTFNHLIRDSCELSDVIRNRLVGVDKTVPLINDLIAIVETNGDLSNVMPTCMTAGGFYVRDCEDHLSKLTKRVVTYLRCE